MNNIEHVTIFSWDIRMEFRQNKCSDMKVNEERREYEDKCLSTSRESNDEYYKYLRIDENIA